MKTINYKNIEWIVLEENEEYKKLITKDILPKEIMKNLTGNDSQYCIFDVESNCYDTSYIRNIIRLFGAEYLNENDLIPFDNTNYVRLITVEEVLKYDNELMQCNDWYWTMTPFIDSDMYLAWSVIRGGGLGYGTVSLAGHYGVRPVICLKSNVLDENKKIEKLGLYDLTLEDTDITKDLILTYQGVTTTIQETRDKINELIDIIKEMSD